MQFGSHTSYKKNNGGNMRNLILGHTYTASNRAPSDIDYIIPLRYDIRHIQIQYPNGTKRTAPGSNLIEAFLFSKSGKGSKQSISISWFGKKIKKNT